MTTLKINDRPVSVPASWQDATLLELLRDHLGLTGTKFGCGGGYCGACTVHLNGAPVRACAIPVVAAAEADVRTIEGLADGAELHPVQQAWKEGNVPQCGYCQPGQIMSAAALLAHNAAPTESEVTAAMNGNLCRCGTYPRIRKAVLRAAELIRERA